MTAQQIRLILTSQNCHKHYIPLKAADLTRKNQLTISQMRAFEAVARTGSVIEAARDQHISQASVSTQTRTVERYANSQLFIRKARRFELTDFGDKVFQRIRTALHLVDEVESLLASNRELDSGVLRIGYSTDSFAIPVIARFARQHPGMRIEARSMASLDLLERLNKNEAELAMITAGSPPEGYHHRLLRRDAIVLIARADHPLMQLQQPVSWQALDGLEIIQRETSSTTRGIFEEAVKNAGIRMSSMIEVGSWASMAQAVAAGIGVGTALEGELENHPELCVVRIDDPSLIASHYLVTPEQMQTVTSVAAFFDIATAPQGEMIEDGL